MKSITYLIMAVLLLANFASAGKKHHVAGGTILDISRSKKRDFSPRGVRDLFGRRTVPKTQ